jgi:tetratricopeptide (TPR) repeat protein
LPPPTDIETEAPKDKPPNPFLVADSPFVPIEHAFPPANRFPPAKRPKAVAPWKVALRHLGKPREAALMALLLLALGYYLFSPTTHSESSLHASVPKPAEAPAAPATDPYLAGYPALQESEAQTDGYVTAAALAIATDDRTEWQRAITNLHTDAPAHDPVPPSEFQSAFADFSVGLSPDHFDEAKWQELLKNLRQVLRHNPYDDETAYELGWLSLVGGKRDEARIFFLHAIWVNPDRANAWYGLGVVGADDNQKTGALTTAELLTADPTQAQTMRNAFPPLLLRLSSVNPDRFAGLQTWSRHLADHYRPLVASPKYE